jgi:WXG100 family type VII secretion target
MAHLPDPATLRAVADHITAQAGAARDEALRLRAAVAGSGWTGRAAAAFDHAATPVVSGLGQVADRLDGAASALRRHADNVQQTLDELRSLGVDLAHCGQDVLHLLHDGLSPRAVAHDLGSLGEDVGRSVGDAARTAWNAVGL